MTPRPYVVTFAARETGRRVIRRVRALDPAEARAAGYRSLARRTPGNPRAIWRVVAIEGGAASWR